MNPDGSIKVVETHALVAAVDFKRQRRDARRNAEWSYPNLIIIFPVRLSTVHNIR